jgi:hypothetical protein
MAELGSFSLPSQPPPGSFAARRAKTLDMAPLKGSISKPKPLPEQAKKMLEIGDKLKHTQREEIETIFSNSEKDLKDELIIDMDYIIRFVGNRLIIEVFGYETSRGKKTLDKPYIFYRSTGRSRGDGLANIYLPSCLGEDHNNYVVSIHSYADKSGKPQKFISYRILEALGQPTIPKQPESTIISLVGTIENVYDLVNRLPEIEFFKDPDYLNNKITFDLFEEINIKAFPPKTSRTDGQLQLINKDMNKIQFEYFNMFDITLNDLLKYGRLLNKEIALMAKWLFDNNDTITLQSFIFDHYYMASELVASYDYKSMVEELDKFKEIDNQNLFRYKFKNANWFVNHCNELFYAKADKFSSIGYDKLTNTKAQTKSKKVANGLQNGGNKKTKRCKRSYKH